MGRHSVFKKNLTLGTVFLLVSSMWCLTFLQKAGGFSFPYILDVGISYEETSVPLTPPITMTPEGHRNIKNTLVYTQLVEFGAEEEYHVRVARTLNEACELAEVGFEYVTDMDDAKIFRKRK